MLKPDDKILSLIGEPLSGVAFVQDYVEFHFDGKILRSLTAPWVDFAGVAHPFPEAGSRDALCSLIGSVAEGLREEDNVEIEVQFSGGAKLHIPLAERHRVGPEAAHFVPGLNQPMDVW
jgi:hypothetical protein